MASTLKLDPPLRVEAVVNGKRITATVVKPAEAVRQGKSEAVYRSTLKVGPLDASLTIQYDCDGAMHATVTYSGMKAKIDSLELVGEVDGLVEQVALAQVVYPHCDGGVMEREGDWQ